MGQIKRGGGRYRTVAKPKKSGGTWQEEVVKAAQPKKGRRGLKAPECAPGRGDGSKRRGKARKKERRKMQGGGPLGETEASIKQTKGSSRQALMRNPR